MAVLRSHAYVADLALCKRGILLSCLRCRPLRVAEAGEEVAGRSLKVALAQQLRDRCKEARRIGVAAVGGRRSSNRGCDGRKAGAAAEAGQERVTCLESGDRRLPEAVAHGVRVCEGAGDLRWGEESGEREQRRDLVQATVALRIRSTPHPGANWQTPQQ